MSIMKTIKKTTKKLAKKVTETITKTADIKVCPDCRGTGLWRPEYTNSPQCGKCTGHGFIN